MRNELTNDLSRSEPGEVTSSEASGPPPAPQEDLVETSLVELSALLIVVLAGIVLTFTGAGIALFL